MAQPAVSSRTVVLLKPTERKKLDRLAASQHASSGEILRRSLRAYEPENSDNLEEDELLASMLHDANLALDKALDNIRSARIEIRENLDKIERARLGQQ